MTKNKDCNYILVDNKMYLNVNQGLCELFFSLYLRGKPFKIFQRPTRYPILNSLPIHVIRGIRVLQFIYLYNKAKKRNIENQSFVTTKHFGHCLLVLRQGGVKVFNLRRKVVTTDYSNCLTEIEVKERIKSIRMAAKCKLAPCLITWDVYERFTIERYLNISSSSYDISELPRFHSNLFPILINILSTTDPKSRSLFHYSMMKINSLTDKMQRFSGSTSNDIEVIKEFLLYVQNSLEKNSNQDEIYTVFSHGDLWEDNVLVEDNYAYVLDWNTVGFRSYYFDFYYVMFMQVSKNNQFDKVDKEAIRKLTGVIETSLNLFCKEICSNNKNGNVNRIPEQSAVYRYLFYLDLVFLKFEATNVSKDNHLKGVMTWINRFKMFEEQRIKSS